MEFAPQRGSLKFGVQSTLSATIGLGRPCGELGEAVAVRALTVAA